MSEDMVQWMLARIADMQRNDCGHVGVSQDRLKVLRGLLWTFSVQPMRGGPDRVPPDLFFFTFSAKTVLRCCFPRTLRGTGPGRATP